MTAVRGSAGVRGMGGEDETADRCMPWPLALLCWLDNRAHDRCGSAVGDESKRLCRAHDAALSAWVRVRWVLG